MLHYKVEPRDLFVAWFLKCFVTENETDAIGALVGGPRDKNLDAIFIDDASKTVFVVQGKYRQRLNGGLENRSDVTTFATLAHSLSDRDALRSYLEDLDSAAAVKVEAAANRIIQRKYI
jgi:hypothetical protein